MIRNPRRPYIQSPQPEKPSVTVANISDMNEESLKSLIVDSLKALSKNLDELKQSVSRMEESFNYLDNRQRKVENEIERFSAKSREAEADLLKLRNDIEAFKSVENTHTYSRISNMEMDKPIMQGTGFACVTPNFLKSRHPR